MGDPTLDDFAERRASICLDDLPVPVFCLNHLEQVVATNREARELCGLRPDACKGQPIQALLNFTCSLREEFQGNTGDVHSHRLTIASSNAPIKPVLLTIQRTNDGGPIHYVCVVSSSETIHAGAAESSAELAAMGQMIAGFAHEVRNPLAALKSIVENLTAEIGASEAWGMDLTRLGGLVGRIERLTRGSLRMVQSERANRREVAVSVLLGTVIELLGSRLRVSPGAAIKPIFEVEAPAVFVDESQIVQVLVIVLENAIDAAESVDRVRVRVRAEPGPRSDAEGQGAAEGRRMIVIDIEDDGPGIPPEILGKIFNPFFTKKPRGTGLGLSIALKLLRDNQGRIRVTSQVGKGSVFSVELPGAP